MDKLFEDADIKLGRFTSLVCFRFISDRLSVRVLLHEAQGFIRGWLSFETVFVFWKIKQK